MKKPSDVMPKPAVALNRRSTPDLVGTVLDGRYRIVGRLGSGGVSAVYEAEDLRLMRNVAIKVVGTGGAESMSRLRREARAVASIHHPNILDIYDFGVLPAGEPYLVLERLAGETLHEHLVRSRRLMPMEAADIFQQLLSGLHAAHSVGIVHRDLKPANVFLVQRLNTTPLVKLFDFGFAFDVTGQLWRRITAVGKTCGTPHYMSPEQLRGENTDGRSDIFSIGIVMFEALTGRHPYPDADVLGVGTKILREPPVAPSTIRPIPRELDAIVLRAMQKDPRDRFESALEMQVALLALQPREYESPSSSSNEVLPRFGSGTPTSS